MKSLSSILFLVIVSLLQPAAAQIAMSFEEAEAQGLDFKKLDSIYKSGLGSESNAVFAGQEDAYIEAYYGLLNDLGSFLNKNDFYWGGQVKCNNRIYFDADGTVDYYLFDFEANLPQTRKDTFKKLLGQFISEYKFGLTASERFAEVSPANYRDPL